MRKILKQIKFLNILTDKKVADFSWLFLVFLDFENILFWPFKVPFKDNLLPETNVKTKQFFNWKIYHQKKLIVKLIHFSRFALNI